MAQRVPQQRSALAGLGAQLGLAVAVLVSLPPLFPVVGPVVYLALLLDDMGWPATALLALCGVEVLIGWMVFGFVIRKLPTLIWAGVVAVYYMATYAAMALMLASGERVSSILRHPGHVVAGILKAHSPLWVVPLAVVGLLVVGYVGYVVGRRMSRWFKRSRLLGRIVM